MQWVIIAASVIGGLFILYQGFIIVAGSFRKLQPIPCAKPLKSFAAVIPARNEEKVIGQLVDSLTRQNYPADLFDVYVIPNNCSDDTEGAARRAGAKILKMEGEIHSKGDVLHETFARLLESGKEYDGFLIFDADNIVDPGFVQAANNAMCAGYQVGQGYRDSKNPDDNWVAGCTSVFFWFMNRLFNRPRAALGMSAHLNGTGILIGSEMVKKHGYHVRALTEDLEFTAQCALAGVKIAWMPEAITYDEQPIRFIDSWTQRRRWAAGTRQCLCMYGSKLYRRFFQSKACMDVALHFSGVAVQILSLFPGLMTIGMLIRGIVDNPADGLRRMLIVALLAIIACLLAGAVAVAVISLLEKKYSRARIVDMGTMGWYLLTWTPANIIGYCFKTPKWKAIPHVSQVSIAQRRKKKTTLSKETETA